MPIVMNRNILIIVIVLAMTLLSTMSFGNNYEKDVFTTATGKKLEITFIKHGSLMLNYDGYIIHIDPVSEYADYTLMPKADIVLITHEHGDHLDPEAINDLWKKGTTIISNKVAYQIIQKGEFMDNGDILEITPFLLLEAVPAYNTTPGREKFHPKHRDNGYILRVEDLSIYVAGDTEDVEEMRQLEDIDIAFLPVNQPYTMTIEQAVRAAEMFNPAILYPYHYGETEIDELAERLKYHAKIEVRIRQMQ